MLSSEFGWYRGNRNTKFVPVRIDRDFLYLGVRRLKYMQILEDFDGKALPKLETDRLILRQRTVGMSQPCLITFAWKRLPIQQDSAQ